MAWTGACIWQRHRNRDPRFRGISAAPNPEKCLGPSHANIAWVQRTICSLLRLISLLSNYLTILSAANAALQERTISMLAQLIRIFRAWRRYDANLRELSSLGDRELAEIGVSRSEIQRIAWETARR
jgi:uncharacterized protein YjiS (DUF1127 family)